MFQHYILTRFNLRKEDWNTTKTNTKVLTDEWMRNRLELFENYCFSSLKHQSEKNFTWLVFFDTSTPEEFRQIISRLDAEFTAFTPIYIDGMNAFYPSIKKEIQASLTQPYLITSRLDNDDALHQDYVKEVQANFNQQDFMAVDFIDGFTLQIAPQVRFAKRSHVHNPFLSLIEKSEGFKTIWANDRHGAWSKTKKVTPIRNKPMWMSVIHMENKVNDFHGFGNVDWQEASKFNINKNVLDDLKAEMVSFESWKKSSFQNQIKTSWKVGSKLLKRKLSL
ncbi:glycosyltransferase [Pseudocolwellia sp. HL-MZ19]|uniref:glycosyltransferase n=1 Tax=unclassified Pseudocolwellia TaxID=2848178 RepID=UPI003CFA2475